MARRSATTSRRTPDPVTPPLPHGVQAQLQRSEAELLAAQFSSEPWERFSHAHLAALRAAAALVQLRGRPGGRGAPRAVWEMLQLVEPGLSRWASYFADGAALRAAVESGRFDEVGPDRADEALAAAEDFVDGVQAIVAPGDRAECAS